MERAHGDRNTGNNRPQIIQFQIKKEGHAFGEVSNETAAVYTHQKLVEKLVVITPTRGSRKGMFNNLKKNTNSRAEFIYLFSHNWKKPS